MFRTELKAIPADFTIDLEPPILSMGSCFANEIGQRLFDFKFSSATNPGGILFNPVSIFRLMAMALNEESLPEWSFTQRQGMYLNFLMHSDFAAAERPHFESAIEGINLFIREKLERSDLIILTFGTAFVHEHIASGEIVANCHKVPQKHFNKRLLSIEEITKGFDRIKALIEPNNPSVKFLLTVSPVRHTKEGLPENNVSKSILRMACHQLTKSHDNVSYFPSYEIMMDDLRDYRFYKSDMIHPNEQAIDYIWNCFADTYFTKATKSFIAEWEKVKSALNHKPFNCDSAEHQQFLKSTIEKLQNFSDQVDVSEEVASLQRQLKPT